MTTLAINKEYTIVPEYKAALHAKCPRCRTGNMFANSMYGFHGQKMNEFCPHCNMKFEREPGYFYVAMFVSYAMNVAQMVTLAVATYILTGSMNAWLYIAILLGASVAVSPVTFRYSRVILLYWLTPGLHFNAEKARPRIGEDE